MLPQMQPLIVAVEVTLTVTVIVIVIVIVAVTVLMSVRGGYEAPHPCSHRAHSCRFLCPHCYHSSSLSIRVLCHAPQRGDSRAEQGRRVRGTGRGGIGRAAVLKHNVCCDEHLPLPAVPLLTPVWLFQSRHIPSSVGVSIDPHCCPCRHNIT